MSDILRVQRDQGRTIDQLAVIERPAVRLPYAQRQLNPFPAASAPDFVGDFAQAAAIVPLQWRVTVYVATTNTASHYWTLSLIDASGTTRATLTTSALAANTWARLQTTTLTTPSASNPVLALQAAKTGAPGGIYIIPELLVSM